MTLAIASGKGGTGKTTLAVGLALLWPGKVTLVDADVEEPNGGLFLALQNSRTSLFSVPIPKVDPQKCTSCGKCSNFCAYGALVKLGDRILHFPDLCHSCGGCTLICPEGAIQEIPRQTGKIETADFSDFHTMKKRYIQGILDPGEAMAPPLIRRIKQRASENIAEPMPSGSPQKKSLTIIDAPPGASCPMTTATSKADMVLLVTENSPFGAHDLEKAFRAVQEMGIPMGAVINRYDLGDRWSEKMCQSLGIPILLKLPFSREIAESYARGVHPVWVSEDFREGMAELINNLERHHFTSAWGTEG